MVFDRISLCIIMKKINVFYTKNMQINENADFV